MLKHFLLKLLEQKSLSIDEIGQATHCLFNQETDELQITAFLALMRSKTETPSELFTMLNIMREKMIVVPTHDRVLDIVGTGGDNAGTVNISTGASILAASCGVKVAKHGNRAVSSRCGSADVLEALGMNIQLAPEKIAQSILKYNFGFCFAPQFHPVLIQLRSLRQRLKIPTTFNLLGPLLNPAKASHYVLGVYDTNLLNTFAELLSKLSNGRSIVFHSEKLDEITSLGKTTLIEIHHGHLDHFEFDPVNYGFKPCSLSELQGGSSEKNAELLLNAFEGGKNAIADALVLNAAFAVYCYGIMKNIEDSIEFAKQQLQNKSALRLLKDIIQFTQEEVTYV